MQVNGRQCSVDNKKKILMVLILLILKSKFDVFSTAVIPAQIK